MAWRIAATRQSLMNKKSLPFFLRSASQFNNRASILPSSNPLTPLYLKQHGSELQSFLISKLFVQVFRSSTSPRWSSSSAIQTEDGAAPVLEDSELDILQTTDGQALFSRISSMKLLRMLVNLQMVAWEPSVDLSVTLLKSQLMNWSFYRVPMLWIVKNTVYEHFCAGETLAEASRTLQGMWEQGLQGILDYSLEDAMDNLVCDQNLRGFLNTIKITRELPQGSVSSVCMKITAIAPLSLLERVSELLRWQHKTGDFRLPWRQDTPPFLSSSSPTFHVRSQPLPLSAEEERDLERAHERLDRLCKACEEVGFPLLVDAEYSSVQPAIDYLTYVAALQHNRDMPLVFTTIQAYLKDALSRLSLALEASSRHGMAFGVKLVRGAYITRENALASALRASSPIHSSIQETHRCFDACATMMLEHLSAGTRGAVIVATHNSQSGRAAACKAVELGLAKGDSRLEFAQLKGMADGLSLALARSGFHVSKYLPFGPLQQVIPYLIRRAEENRGLLGCTLEDRSCIRAELKRRLFASIGS